MIQRDISITDPQGVHALVAQELATLAKRFASSLFLRHQGRMASLDNSTAILALGVREGTMLAVWADGIDENEALVAVIALLAGRAATPTDDPAEPLKDGDPE